MHTFNEILQLFGILIGFFIILVAGCFLQCKTMTEKEMTDYADFWDEFLYGDKFR